MNDSNEIQEQNTESASTSAPEPTYEAPAIESVVTPDSLEREVFYAGLGSIAVISPGGGGSVPL